VWGDFEFVGRHREDAAFRRYRCYEQREPFFEIISSEVDKVINVPVMSVSETNGIAGCIYNMTIPNIDNWRRFAQGSRFGAGSLAEIYANPLIAKKVCSI
jgi:hypothetical protein